MIPWTFIERRAIVPYFKCTPCRLRIDGRGPEMDLVDGRCPTCGERLAPVRQLTEVVGFQSFKLGQASASSGEDEQDAQRWLDEGGSFSSEAVARSAPPPKP